MKFPDDWPDGCPPNVAEDVDGEVFRIVKNDPPNADDMATHLETGRLPKAPACLRCGLSVFRELQEAIHQRSLFPRLGSMIARAKLTSEHGKTKLTEGRQPTHTTWWAYKGVNRAVLFSVITDKD